MPAVEICGQSIIFFYEDAMKFFRTVKSGFIVSGILLFAVILLCNSITGDSSVLGDDNMSACEKCDKSKTKTHPRDKISSNTIKDESNFAAKIFSLLTSKTNDSPAENVTERDPEKDKAVSEIISLSKSVCNEENLPDDIWVSPKLIEKDPHSHVKELEKLVLYCRGLKTGKTTIEEKREYYLIKIKLLEERKELVQYYIETLSGQIEDMSEKKIADMKERKKDDKLTREEEKINAEIEAETKRFYEDTVANTDKIINQIDAAIKNYKTELVMLY